MVDEAAMLRVTCFLLGVALGGISVFLLTRLGKTQKKTEVIPVSFIEFQCGCGVKARETKPSVFQRWTNGEWTTYYTCRTCVKKVKLEETLEPVADA